MVLLIDNYDSFSYNLYQMAGEIEPDIRVVKNDQFTVAEVKAMEPSHIILSPGPGRPSQAGICEEVVRKMLGKVPILGICLGHQAICEVMGSTITYATNLMHGKKSTIRLDESASIFSGLPSRVQAGRYHSLAVLAASLPNTLQVIAQDEDGEIMAVKHRQCAVYGLQFHPESILTPSGARMIENFLLCTEMQECLKE